MNTESLLLKSLRDASGIFREIGIYEYTSCNFSRKNTFKSTYIHIQTSVKETKK